MDVQTWLTIIAVAVAIGGFFAGIYWNRKRERGEQLQRSIERQADEVNKQTDRNGAITSRLSDLERQIGALGVVVQPLSAAYQAMLVKQLTHFHTPRADDLLAKLGPPVTLTAAEETELSVILEHRSKDLGPEISDLERDAATMLPLVIKRLRLEQDLPAPTEMKQLQVVIIPPGDEASQP